MENQNQQIPQPGEPVINMGQAAVPQPPQFPAGMSAQNELPVELQPETEIVFNGYAEFWKRALAAIIDFLILFIATLALGIVGLPSVLNFIVGILYFAFFESSEKQATPGKQALGIKVVNAQGQRISFQCALIRDLGKIVSSLILFIGYIMAAFTERSQALHDFIAGTFVINE